MKKSYLRKVVSLALSCALIISSITVFNSEAKAATLEELATMVADADYNLALNKSTTIYPGCAEGNQVNLNNGALGAGGAHCALSSAWGYLNESYVIIDLGEYYDASSIDEIMIQYKDAVDNDTVVSRTYKIEYSVDGVTYYDAVAETAVSELDENRMTIDDVSGVEGVVRYVKVYYPTTATYGIQITEIAIFAENPEIAEVETCDEAAGIIVEVTDYNTIKYNIIAGENQEDYVYMVYLDGTTKIGDAVSAGVDYIVDGIAAGTHTLKVIAIYDGKVSLGINSEEVEVFDVSELISNVKNIVNINNNPEAKIIDVSSIYEDANYTLDAAQVALDGLYPSGEGANVALRTASGVTPASFVVDLGEYYRAVEFDKVIVAHPNPRTYAATVTVEFSEDNENYVEVGSRTGYTCLKDNAGTADLNVFALDAEKLEAYTDSVRYVKVTLAEGSSNWGYVVNEFALVLNTETPLTGLQPKLNDIVVDTEIANTVDVKVAATVGFEDAEYKAVLLDENNEETGLEAELSLEEGYFAGTISNVAKGDYKVKIVVNYEGGTKTVDKTINNITVINPKVASAEVKAEMPNEITINWETTGYYAGQKYNVYLDGELYAADIECEEGEEEYTITEVPAGTHYVSVSVVVDEDETELCTVEGITVNPAEITADNGYVRAYANLVYVMWEHELIEGEEAEYTVSLKGTDKSAVLEANEDGYYEYTFNDLPIGEYIVVVTAVVNGVTISVESEAVQTQIEYAVEPNRFIMSVYFEEEIDSSETEVLYFNDETVEIAISDMTYDAETKLYTYVKYLSKGTYDIKISDEIDLCTVEIEDVVVAPVTGLKAIKNGKNVELTWDATDALEGQTYTVYVNKVSKADGLTDTKYTLADMPVGSYVITVEAIYTNPYSGEVYVESADCEIQVEAETTTVAPTDAPTINGPTSVNPSTQAGEVTPPVSTKVKSASKKLAAKNVKLSIKKVKDAKGYQVQFSTTKKFKKVLVTKTVKKVKLTVKNKKFKNKKKIFVRVKAYKLNGNEKVWAEKWSKAKKVKIK